MAKLYAIRGNKIETVIHLRGKLYCPATLAEQIEVRNEKKYAPTEWIIADKNIFCKRGEAKAEIAGRNKAGAERAKREKEKQKKHLQECEKLRAEIFAECNELGIDPHQFGLGFCTSFDLRDILRGIREAREREEQE